MGGFDSSLAGFLANSSLFSIDHGIPAAILCKNDMGESIARY